MEERWGKPAGELPADHPAWKEEARLLACGLVNWICTLSPKIIVIGGGVMKQAALFPMMRANVETMLNGYVPIPEIVPPALGDDAGVLGAVALCL